MQWYTRPATASRRHIIWGVVLSGAVAVALAAAVFWVRPHEAEAADAGVNAPSALRFLLPLFGQVLAAGASDAGDGDDDGGIPSGPCETEDDCGEGQCCDGTCIDTANDPLNCGGCGEPCAVGVACSGGTCAADCDTAQCPPGFMCMELGDCTRTSCGEGSSDVACALAPDLRGLCCAGECIDPLRCHAHCGVCDSTCGSGEFCNQGDCASNVNCADPDAGEANCPVSVDQLGSCCGGRCIATDNDAENCGACGRVCATGEICARGDCVVPRCDGIPSDQSCLAADGGKGFCCDGACRALSSFRSDPQNCGACRAHCPRQATCTEGSCEEPDSGRMIKCHRGDCAPDEVCMPDGICLRDDCAGAHDNLPCARSSDMEGVCCGGTCTDVSQDPASCGRCGVACDGGEICDESVCKGFSGCDQPGATVCPFGPAVNGVCCGPVCVDPLVDGHNCGACDNVCPTGRTCDHGSCRAVSCEGVPAGEACQHPSGEPAECCHGKCVRVESFDDDLSNCGDCGLACSSGDKCELGVCNSPDSGLPVDCSQTGCPAGQACVEGQRCVSTLCSSSEDGMRCAGANASLGSCCGGRCIDLRLDTQNCGACGNACGPTEFCNLGSCGTYTGCDAGGACPLGTSHLGMCCGGGCVDVERDAKNCGRCGRECGDGAVCESYGCVDTSPATEGGPDSTIVY